MHSFTSLLLFLVLSFFLVGSFGAEEDVIVLTNENFDSIVNDKEIILVEFYAPWCGHCKKLAPNYAEAAGILKKHDPPIPLAKVDATEEKDLGTRFGIRGYPTLKIFRNGVESDYKGPRETEGIVAFMKKQAAPSYRELRSSEDLENFVKDNSQSSVVAFLSDANSALGKSFLALTGSLRDSFKFGLVKDLSLAKEGHKDAVVIFKPFNEKEVVYTGSTDRKALENFLFDNYLATVSEWTEDSSQIILKKNKPVLKAYFDVNYDSNLKRTNYYRNRIKKIATSAEFSDKLVFTMLQKKTFQSEMDKFAFPPSNEISIGIENGALRYKMEDEFNVENLRKFVQSYLDGELEAYIKSEPIPEKNDGPVTVVVGKTFNDIVMDDTKDVLFEMYAPWCGHCKKLEPIYNELGESLKDVENIVIAKMDATANDSPHSAYQAKGYPTILFAPAGKKDNPIKYQGEREVKAFKEFLKKNASQWKEKKSKDEL